MPQFDTLSLLLSANLILLLFQMIQLYRGRRISKQFAINSDHMKTDINALCRGATNLDRHITAIEEKLRRLTERQDKLEAADSVKREYENAIRAVKSGASVDRLISLHGLSQAEARMLVTLHGEEETASAV
jgi:hypothetical protein